MSCTHWRNKDINPVYHQSRENQTNSSSWKPSEGKTERAVYEWAKLHPSPGVVLLSLEKGRHKGDVKPVC